jgi:hypothetical protein
VENHEKDGNKENILSAMSYREENGRKQKLFICKCGALRVQTDDSCQIYLVTRGKFRLERAGKLMLVEVVCPKCGKPPKG